MLNYNEHNTYIENKYLTTLKNTFSSEHPYKYFARIFSNIEGFSDF